MAFISDHPLASIVTVLVWQWTPFMMVIMLAGLQSQPSDIPRAAAVDGATPFGVFGRLTLPHLRRYLELGATRLDLHRQAFDMIDVMTGAARIDERHASLPDRSAGVPATARVRVRDRRRDLRVIIATFALRVLSGLLKDEDRA